MPEDDALERRRLAGTLAADRQRLAALPPPSTTTSTSPDGSVTVEVAPGGALCSVRLTQPALSRGGAQLAQSVLDTARRATARANHRASTAVRNALGDGVAAQLDELGLGYDPELVDDRQRQDPDSGFQWSRP